MPRIRRHNLPPHLLDHLLDRISRRNISADQLGLMANWLCTEPEVPEGPWFKKFPGLTVCGEGELIKTFLQPGQVATGKELLNNSRQTPDAAPDVEQQRAHSPWKRPLRGGRCWIKLCP